MPSGVHDAESWLMMVGEAKFQSTRPVWAATPDYFQLFGVTPVSIHAARVGRDERHDGEDERDCVVSIHAARVGRDRSSG